MTEQKITTMIYEQQPLPSPLFEQKIERKVQALLQEEKQPVQTRRPMLILIVVLLLLLSMGALAATMLPSIQAWLSGWTFSDAVGQIQPTKGTLATVEVEGITFTCVEAMADDRMYFANIRAEGKGDVLLVPYSGQDWEASTEGISNPRNLPIVFVHATVRCGGEAELSDITEDAENNTPYFLCNGSMEANHSSDQMTLVADVLIDGKTTRKTVPFSIDQLPTIEDYSIPEPIVLGNTGYTLTSLSLHRTAFRTYVEYDFVLENMPLEMALKQPTMHLMQKDGSRLFRYWPYDEGVPEEIRVEVWNHSRDELLFEQTLTPSDFVITKGEEK